MGQSDALRENKLSPRGNTTLRVVISTNQLDVRAGSELYSLELAQGLQESGHEVALFTLFPGKLYNEVRQSLSFKFFGPECLDELRSFHPNIVHSHHVTCGHIMAHTFPEIPRVHGVLGIIPPLEKIPSTVPSPKMYLAVSEEVKTAIARDGNTSLPIEIMRNWFDEHDVKVKILDRSSSPIEVVIVSNHWLPDIDRALEPLEATGQINITRFGLGHESRKIDGELLCQFDLVVTIGRTALLAAACGIPCILAGHHGSDGLLTSSSLERVRQTNFSGRAFGFSADSEHFRKEISKIGEADIRALQIKVVEQYSLASRAVWLGSLYRRFCEVNVGRVEPTHGRCGGEAEAFLMMEREIARLQGELAAARREIEETRMSRSWKITEPLRRVARYLK